MFDVLVGMKADIELLKTAFGNALRVGPVEVVDAERGYRLKLGEGTDGTPFLSPWYPHPESGGQTSSWSPLSKGQIVGVLNPSGDMRQGVIFRAGFSDANSAPSADLAANVLKAFGITVTMKDGTLSIKGNVSITGNLKVDGDVDFRGGHVRHNDTPIDDTHRHGGVRSGNDDTSVPVEGD